VRFNLSHAGERALLALSIGRELGIDIEAHRPIEMVDLACQFFAAVEYARLVALPPSERVDACFRCWTRKEAFVKALEDGLTFPLDGFEADIEPGPVSQALLTCRKVPDAVEQWRIVPLDVERGYSAAVAVQSGDWTIRRRTS
jgi:4'-phosphopantetheinyl transferase